MADESNPKSNHIENQIKRYEQRLQRLASELSLTEARERKAIASDLHDHVGQALAFVRMKLSQLQGNSVFCGFEKDFSMLISLMDQTIAYTRNLTVEISPPVLFELGLTPAIEWLAEQMQARHGYKVKFTKSGKPVYLAEDMRILIFKSIQELMTNVAKHAAAKKVKIYLSWSERDINLKVEDNGRGFDSVNLESRIINNEVFGLFSIKERLKYIGGEMTIDSSPGKGTSVSLALPIISEDSESEN